MASKCGITDGISPVDQVLLLFIGEPIQSRPRLAELTGLLSIFQELFRPVHFLEAIEKTVAALADLDLVKRGRLDVIDDHLGRKLGALG